MDEFGMPLKASQLPPCFGVPQSERVVPAPREDSAPVRRESHAVDIIQVPVKPSHFRPRLGVPQPQHFVRASRKDSAAIRRESHTTSTQGNAAEAGLFETAPENQSQRLARLDIPDPQSAVTGSGNQPAAVWRKGCAIDQEARHLKQSQLPA